jgi:thioredoxin-related protein
LGQFNNGNISLPSMIFLNEESKAMDIVPFYLDSEITFAIINYYGNNIYLEKKWDEYFKDFKEKK